MSNPKQVILMTSLPNGAQITVTVKKTVGTCPTNVQRATVLKPTWWKGNENHKKAYISRLFSWLLRQRSWLTLPWLLQPEKLADLALAAVAKKLADLALAAVAKKLADLALAAVAKKLADLALAAVAENLADLALAAVAEKLADLARNGNKKYPF